MTSRFLDVVTALWPCMLLGSGLVIAGTTIGWLAGRHASLPPVRLVSWWIRSVILPLLDSPFWWRRAATIFVNNLSVLVVLVALGSWQAVAPFGAATLGLSLGIALRALWNQSKDLPLSEPRTTARRQMQIGLSLNLLEPPAIVIAIGLSIGQGAILLGPSQVWLTFAVLVAPTLFLAAGGEALWLGAIRPSED